MNNNHQKTRGQLAERYQQIRGVTEALAGPLAIEDYVVQSMPDVSPTKWHLAHTSWFFASFILAKAKPHYRPCHEKFHYLYNSYYVLEGERHCRAKRGLLSRPSVEEIYAFRKHIDEEMFVFFEEAAEPLFVEYAPVIEIGLQHEQQHQELLLADIKHVFAQNPIKPAYLALEASENAKTPLSTRTWQAFDEGLYKLGHPGDGFAYDNEQPCHQYYLQTYQLASRLVTNGEYLAFVQIGGYHRPEFWLSDGWACVEQQKWAAPLYWQILDGQWHYYTLGGVKPIVWDEPVCHVSFYEADAYARWKGVRLPSEMEWEVAAADQAIQGNFVEQKNFHPKPCSEPSSHPLLQMFGDVWEWTSSPYLAYPGFKALPGALGEYNGKFMCNQFVLRGGSCVTSQSHMRKTYRNFFYPDSRWQFSGIRLAKEGRGS